MELTPEKLKRIYERTSGYCHLCYCKLSRINYGQTGRKGAWHVEHSVPRAKGGSDHLNNLFAACISCNLTKGAKTTRTARGWNGKTRAPLSAVNRKKAKAENGVFGALSMGIAGFALAGPMGGLFGALVGSQFGESVNPDK